MPSDARPCIVGVRRIERLYREAECVGPRIQLLLQRLGTDACNLEQDRAHCFAHFLGQGMEPTAALTRAARYAALSITRRGTQTSYATPAEFDDFLSEHGLG